MRIKSPRKKGVTCDVLSKLQIPVYEPVMATNIKLSWFDWNAGKRNDRISTICLDYKNVKKNKITPRWIPMYGAQVGCSRGIARKMNQGFIAGSAYRGEVLLAVEVRKETNPKKGVTDLGNCFVCLFCFVFLNDCLSVLFCVVLC